MAQIYETDEEIERVLLIGVALDDNDEAESSLDELAELAKTAGAVTVGRLIQPREYFHPATYIGKGKLEEVRLMADELDATGIICDDELTPAQFNNLSQMLDVKVVDRTVMILDIFAKRASTSEGKLQVELAQLRYRASHLIGGRSELSRLGGGIGTRGPGEKKLEIDRRLINDRISVLRREVEELKNHRSLAREKRSRNPIPVVAIVGYTNAGKSTLLNTLTDAGILAEDKLFATLDPTTRNYKLPGGQEVLLTDTVGFIRKLPHHLIDAFRSTLEEARYADLILHVVDSSSEQMDAHMDIVYETLKNLDVRDKQIITFFNKMDKLPENADRIFKDLRADRTVCGSIKENQGLQELVDVLEKMISERSIYVEKVIPYAEAGKIQLIRQYGQLLGEEYTEGGIAIKAYIPGELEGRI